MDVVLIDFNPDSSLLALLCLSDDHKTMSIFILHRSNWKWQVKQKIGLIPFASTKGIRAMFWLRNKK